MNSAIRLGFAATLLGSMSLFGSVINTTVINSAEIYTAGQAGGTAVLVNGLTLTAGSGLTFSVSGVVSGAGCTSTTPDGCSNFLSNSPGTGVARYSGPAQALVGIFLSGTVPSGADPATYLASVSAANFAPGLLQPFFIGDGLTGTGSGSTQTFIVPTGATQLFLGISDNPGFFYDNGGSFQVAIDSVAGNQSILAEAPEPSTYIMIGSALLFTSLGRKRRYSVKIV